MDVSNENVFLFLFIFMRERKRVAFMDVIGECQFLMYLPKDTHTKANWIINNNKNSLRNRISNIGKSNKYQFPVPIDRRICCFHASAIDGAGVDVVVESISTFSIPSCLCDQNKWCYIHDSNRGYRDRAETRDMLNMTQLRPEIGKNSICHQYQHKIPVNENVVYSIPKTFTMYFSSV